MLPATLSIAATKIVHGHVHFWCRVPLLIFMSNKDGDSRRGGGVTGFSLLVESRGSCGSSGVSFQSLDWSCSGVLSWSVPLLPSDFTFPSSYSIYFWVSLEDQPKVSFNSSIYFIIIQFLRLNEFLFKIIAVFSDAWNDPWLLQNFSSLIFESVLILQN